jgi:hypothetical protein
MLTSKTRTEADSSSGNKTGKRVAARVEGVLYKNDRVTVWGTGNGRLPLGKSKEMHPHLADQLAKRGLVSLYETVADELPSEFDETGAGAKKKAKKDK